MASATQRLAPALSAWQQWNLPLQNRPELGSVLAEGSGHVIYALHCDPPLVIRLRHRRTSHLADAFLGEVTIWSQAASAGIAPAIAHIDSAHEVIVCERVKSAAPCAVSGETLGLLAARIHALPAVDRVLTLRSDLHDYLEATPPAERPAWRDILASPEIGHALTLLEHDTPYLCHNDLTSDNLMCRDDVLMAIDWEYAAMGSRYFDAAIAQEQLPVQEHSALFQSIFPEGHDPVLRSAGRLIARLITALWQHRHAPALAPAAATWWME